MIYQRLKERVLANLDMAGKTDSIILKNIRLKTENSLRKLTRFY